MYTLDVSPRFHELQASVNRSPDWAMTIAQPLTPHLAYAGALSFSLAVGRIQPMEYSRVGLCSCYQKYLAPGAVEG